MHYLKWLLYLLRYLYRMNILYTMFAKNDYPLGFFWNPTNLWVGHYTVLHEWFNGEKTSEIKENTILNWELKLFVVEAEHHEHIMHSWMYITI